jgi:hypothetical protein
MLLDDPANRGKLMRVYGSAKLFRDTAADFVTGLLIFFAVYGLALIDSRQAWPAPSGADVLLVHHQSTNAGQPTGTTRGSMSLQSTIDGRGNSDKIVIETFQRATPSLSSSSPTKSAGMRVAQLSKSRPAYTPLGTTANNRMGALAAMALFFAAMCAVTLGFWRHIRRAYASPRRK